MLRTILCATDGSRDGQRALEYAERLVACYDASLRVVLVTHQPLPPHDRVRQERTIAELKAHVRDLRSHDVKAYLHVFRGTGGNPADQISATAAAVHADIVVVGARGRSPLGGAVLGSVTRDLLRSTTTPVLALPPVHQIAIGQAPGPSVREAA